MASSVVRMLTCRSMARLVVARPSVSASATVAANTGRCTRPVARCITTSAARFAISVPLSPAEQLEVVEKTTNVVKKFNRVDPEKVTNDADFIADLGLDSLDAVEIVMALEDEFQIEISDEEAEKITNVRIAIETVSDKVARK